LNLIPTVRIIRVEEDEQGTFGVMTICGQAFCVTLELPDRLNHRDISSIPAQQYLCRKVISPYFGETFEITNVEDRTHVLFHKGNTVSDSHGCIVLGQYFGKLQKDRAVRNSGTTFKSFMKSFEDIDKFKLTIKDEY